MQWLLHFCFNIKATSAVIRFQRKMEPFENSFQSGAIWKWVSLKTLFSSVDGESDAIWKRWRHQNKHDQAPDHSIVSIQNGGQTLPCGFSFDWRCSVDWWKRYENDKCGPKSFWKRSKTAPFSFENGLVWTAPKKLNINTVGVFVETSSWNAAEVQIFVFLKARSKK